MIDQFLELDLPHVEYRQEVSQKTKSLLIDQLIQRYYRYIKYKCFHFRDKNCLYLRKADRVLYFMSLESKKILNELNIVLEFVNRAFLVVDTSKHGHLQFQVNQHVFLALLGDFFTFYSACSIGLSNLLNMKEQLSVEDLLIVKEISKQVYSFSTRLEEFINKCRFIKEFQQVEIDYKVEHTAMSRSPRTWWTCLTSTSGFSSGAASRSRGRAA